jgi:Fe-Mn family superoxide dismutase
MTKHNLPELGYAYNALEPFIDAQTMEIHHTKHHQAYTDKLNAALEKHEDLFAKSAEELLENLSIVPEDIRTAVKNNGGGYINHSFFWTILKINNDALPTSSLLEAINKAFNSFESFKEQFSQAALNHFGSGWAWLVMDNDKNLKIITTANQDSPLSLGLTPIITIDLWEHAYYLNYQNKRADYIAAFWNIIDWPKISNQFDSL